MPRYPVFVVGSPRSGTSILVDALLSAGYHGFREGSFLSLIPAFQQVIDRHFNVFDQGNKAILVSNIDKNRLKDRLSALLKEFTDELHPTPPWLDKTGNPEMILAAPTLRSLWPDCVFVFAKRRAIENVVSRLKKFPNHTFEYHCADWARNMSTWRQVRAGLPAECFVEIDQQDLIQEPNAAAGRIGWLLGLSPEGRENVAKTFRSNRPQQTEENSAARLLSLKATGWSERQQEIFLKHCREEMGAFGYSIDETYRVEPAVA